MVDSRPRVLLVEDDRALVGLLAMTLGNIGCEVQAAYDGATALRRYADERPDVVILDLSLPDMPGEEVCRTLVASGPARVIVLTGRKDEADVARLLDLGADDYVTKPFRRDELLARVRAALRRASEPPRPRERAASGDLVVDAVRHDAVAGGRSLRLSPIEFRILERLVARDGELVSHAELFAAGWPGESVPDPVRLKPHLARLRRKLITGGGPVPRSVRGLGYQLR